MSKQLGTRKKLIYSRCSPPRKTLDCFELCWWGFLVSWGLGGLLPSTERQGTEGQAASKTDSIIAPGSPQAKDPQLESNRKQINTKSTISHPAASCSRRLDHQKCSHPVPQVHRPERQGGPGSHGHQVGLSCHVPAGTHSTSSAMHPALSKSKELFPIFK